MPHLPEDHGDRDRRPEPPTDSMSDLEEAIELAGSSALSDEAIQLLSRRSAEAFEALGRVATTLSENLEFSSLVEQVLDIAIEHIGSERGIVFLGSNDGYGGSGLTPLAMRSVSGGEVEDLERISWTILRRAEHGGSVSSQDAKADPELCEIASVQIHNIRSVLCVPMIARGKSIGVIYLDSPSRRQAFGDHSRRFAEAFAGIAATALENARLHGEVLRENQRLRRNVDSLEAFGRILTVDPRVVELLKRASMIAQVDSPVMLLGESGTGKELLARAIHDAGPRASQAFVAYNCAAVPSGLMESIFFGHTKGAFTGATRDAFGLFRMADRGTLFLDEFVELDETLQAKLLRVLQDGVVRPVGSEAEVHVDVRLITATSRDIHQVVASGRFREDLFFRTNVLELRIPPLRERPDDIPVLVDHFLAKHARDERGRLHLTPEALALLQSLEWRGNVRELENFVQRVVVFANVSPVDVSVVRALLSQAGWLRASDQPRPSQEGPAGDMGPERGEDDGPTTLADQERETIRKALVKAGGNKSKAARILGVHRNSLLRRIERLKIEWDE